MRADRWRAPQPGQANKTAAVPAVACVRPRAGKALAAANSALVSCLALAACVAQPAASSPLDVTAEEIVCHYAPAQNGADPLWAYGSTVITRWQDHVVVSGLETVPGVSPDNNVRCLLYARGADGWSAAWRDENSLTREPCPLGVFQDGRLLLSTNPTLGSGPEPSGGPAQPTLLEFATEDLSAPLETSLPVWAGQPPFDQHSYRGLGVDGARQETLFLNINGYVGQEWAFRDAAGEWSARGRLGFPYDTDTHQVLRLCYPQVALADRQAHVMAISDILEPVPEYRQYKAEQDKNAFLYVFRRLYYAWTPDISSTSFSASTTKISGWTPMARRTCSGSKAAWTRNCGTSSSPASPSP
jgi:hypothetical protein